jgi:hypothetical protein
MKFKGTKGKWLYEVKYGKKCPRITVQIPIRDGFSKELILGTIAEDKCTVSSCCYSEEHANALLISKAPEMLEMLLLTKKTISSLKNSMIAHCDCIEGSEFDDYTTLAQKTEDKIKKLIKEATEL